jgi:hypothetical protein
MCIVMCVKCNRAAIEFRETRFDMAADRNQVLRVIFPFATIVAAIPRGISRPVNVVTNTHELMFVLQSRVVFQLPRQGSFPMPIVGCDCVKIRFDGAFSKARYRTTVCGLLEPSREKFYTIRNVFATLS